MAKSFVIVARPGAGPAKIVFEEDMDVGSTLESGNISLEEGEVVERNGEALDMNSPVGKGDILIITANDENGI